MDISSSSLFGALAGLSRTLKKSGLTREALTVAAEKSSRKKWSLGKANAKSIQQMEVPSVLVALCR